MSGPGDVRWRSARAVGFSGVTTSLALMGHAVGGGGVPDLAVVLVPALAIGAAVSSTARRPRTFGQILGVLVASQLAFHLLFTVTATPGMSMTHLDLPRMVLFHLLAAALSALVMATGESALARFYSAVSGGWTLVRMAGPVDLPLSWVVVSAGVHPLSGREPHSAPRRGPPPAAGAGVAS